VNFAKDRVRAHLRNANHYQAQVRHPPDAFATRLLRKAGLKPKYLLASTSDTFRASVLGLQPFFATALAIHPATK
jgi:hypothetical protein